MFQVSNFSLSYGEQTVFSKISFEVKSNDRIAIIGRNGCGKTSLLNGMAGLLMMDEGQTFYPRGYRIGMLSQISFKDETLSVQEVFDQYFADVYQAEAQLQLLREQLKDDYSEEMLSRYAMLEHQFEERGGYQIRVEMMTILTQFGFSEEALNRPVSSFSGGQKTRLAFSILLLSKPDLLLLDEPTNHLDLKTVEWLETYLNHYEKAIVFVSHDRVFIDRCAKRIIELEYGTITEYSGNYEAYRKQKEQNQGKQLEAYKRQQKELEEMQKLIDRFRYKATKRGLVKSREKMMDKVERIDKPAEDSRHFKASFKVKNRGAKHVLKTDRLAFGYDTVLAEVSFELLRHQHTAIVGDNGTGKSTLLKTLIGQLPACRGELLWGHQIETAYFDQNMAFSGSKSVLEYLWDEYPDLDHSEIRTLLGTFQFTQDEVFKSVNVLSGGERVRLALLKIMLQKANCLILDEPTNHLDIANKEALEEALLSYPGTILFVSHDRYFVQRLAKAVLTIENQQTAWRLIEDVVDEEIRDSKTKPQGETKKRDTVSVSRIEKQIKKLEESIAEKELELDAAREKRFDPEYYHDHRRMQDLDESIDEIHNDIGRLMRSWEEQVELLESYSQAPKDTV